MLQGEPIKGVGSQAWGRRTGQTNVHSQQSPTLSLILGAVLDCRWHLIEARELGFPSHQPPLKVTRERYKFPGTPRCLVYKWFPAAQGLFFEGRSKAWGVGEENWPKRFRGIWVEESVVMSSTYLNLLLREYPFYIPVGASSQDQSFSTLTLLTFGAGGFFVIRGFPVPCRTFNSIPSCDNLDASKYLQTLPTVYWGENPPYHHP